MSMGNGEKNSEEINQLKDIREAIGRNIRKARINKNLSQVQLASILGTSQATITSYENGRMMPRIETLDKIAIALDTPFTSFLPSEFLDGSITVRSEQMKKICELLPLLNSDGQYKVLDYTNDLLGNPKYRLNPHIK